MRYLSHILLSTDLAADLGLSMFVWEARCDSGVDSKRCFLALFDMNRWYNAQMPFHIRSALQLLYAWHVILFIVCYAVTVGTSYIPCNIVNNSANSNMS